MIEANVPNKEFCGCAVNCIIHEHRGTMSELEDKVLKTLNQDQQKLVTAVNNYFEIQKLGWLEGHNHLTNEKQLELRDKVVKYLSMVIVGRTQEWDHISRNQKLTNVSGIYDAEKRSREIQVCVLRDRSCHRFKTIFERAYPIQSQSRGQQEKIDYMVEWKRHRFEENDSCCTLLADLFGEGVSCPFGYGTSAECAAHIERVRNLLQAKNRDDNPLDFYLKVCFDVHHEDPESKKGE